jgi:hypothetical protein
MMTGDQIAVGTQVTILLAADQKLLDRQRN